MKNVCIGISKLRIDRVSVLRAITRLAAFSYRLGFGRLGPLLPVLSSIYSRKTEILKR